MTRTIGLIIILTTFFAFKRNDHDHPTFSFVVADSVKLEVCAILDSQGIVSNYKARIYTPVCEVDKCYTIEIDFYWDLIGRFHHFDTIPGKELTKLDHEPFIQTDYIKLTGILTNQNSLLASFAKEELVTDTRNSEIDGFTGATIEEIKETVIDGAVYSCYALWHIAHGQVVDSIQKNTVKSLNRDIVKKMVNQNDQEMNYFLINNFSENDFSLYLPEVLETISVGKGYYAKNTIEKMPKEIFSDGLSQHYFAENFAQLNYFAQVALLKKLKAELIIDELLIALKENIGNRDSYKKELIKDLLAVNNKIQDE